MHLLDHSPHFSAKTAARLAETHYGLQASATPLPSERDQNFLLTTNTGERLVLKIANSLEDSALLEAQNAIMNYLQPRVGICPRVVTTLGGDELIRIHAKSPDEVDHFVRLVSYIPGTPLAEVNPQPAELLRDLGRKLGQIDKALVDFDHPAVHRDFHWDLANGTTIVRQYASLIGNAELRDLVTQCAVNFENNPSIRELRRSVIHGDANDHNVIVAGSNVVGLIDFGDVVHSYTIGDLAVALAYVVLKKEDPLPVAAEVVAGYHEELPLTELEFTVLFDLMLMRLCMSACHAAHQQQAQPQNEYLKISQTGIEESLPQLASIDRSTATGILRNACYRTMSVARKQTTDTLERRQHLLGRNLSVAYKKPLKIVRGSMQYLYDEAGIEYLDAYNNVAHVGHCHPSVVRAAQDQIAVLNTNTRYLHDLILDYAERLSATLPVPLSVCFFVNSGSEANELALRLARAHTNTRDLIVLDHAYHGNTTTMIDISPYKHDGPGGMGAPSWVHKVPLPDTYRGLYRGDDSQAGANYVRHVDSVLENVKASFICESLPSVGGQIVLPDGYLPQVYQTIRSAGGVCIADEVQTGYGRIGTSFWGFEKYGVSPDIVVLGKPIGNGHPIGAVVTTPEIAASFANGMEFFSTFGGNTVSCAIGLKVLEVVHEERLQTHAFEVGESLLGELRGLQKRHAVIGDVRGSGLFIGVELVVNRETREPATSVADEVVNRMREERILFGTDGPFHNVLKIRPPMPFSMSDASRLVETLDRVLCE